MTTDEDAALRALATWLAARLPDASDLRLTHEGRPGSGFSAETTIIGATWVADGDARTDRFVLRKETPDPPVYPTQVPGMTIEVEIQHRIMSALAGSDVPLAPLVGYEPDPSVLGTPFYVMGFVDGLVPIEAPMYTLEGWFTELSPEQRRTMIDDGVRVLTRVHAFDWRAAGLDWLIPVGSSPTVERQLDVWDEYMTRELQGRSHPMYERAHTWLRAHMPEEESPVLCWGDPRLGNIIWRDDHAVCVTDFEAASIAPALVDLGWWLMFDRWCHESYGAERLPGELTRDDQRARYEEYSGQPVGDTTWYEVFAAARYTAIVVRVMNRTVARGDMPADQTIWLDNPATTCLAQLLEENGL